MSEPSEEKPEKTDLEKSKDIISQLKEMRHYAESNIEKLTAAWLLLDGELKKKKIAKQFEDLLSEQNKLHDEIAKVISDYEEECEAMAAKAEKAAK